MTHQIKIVNLNPLDIKKAREAKGMSQETLAEMLGVSRRTIINYENGGVVPSTKIEPLKRILFGPLEVNEERPTYITPYITEQLIKLPMLTIPAQATFASNLEGNMQSLDDYCYILPEPGKNYNNAMCVEIDGDSMEPELRKSDRILVRLIDPNDWEYLNPGVYAVAYWKRFTVKRIRKNTLFTEGQLELIADNALRGSEIVKHADIKAIWKVEAVLFRRVF